MPNADRIALPAGAGLRRVVRDSIIGNLLSALAIGTILLVARWWVDRYYQPLGLKSSDAGFSYLRLFVVLGLEWLVWTIVLLYILALVSGRPRASRNRTLLARVLFATGVLAAVLLLVRGAVSEVGTALLAVVLVGVLGFFSAYARASIRSREWSRWVARVLPVAVALGVGFLATSTRGVSYGEFVGDRGPEGSNGASLIHLFVRMTRVAFPYPQTFSV